MNWLLAYLVAGVLIALCCEMVQRRSFGQGSTLTVLAIIALLWPLMIYLNLRFRKRKDR